MSSGRDLLGASRAAVADDGDLRRAAARRRFQDLFHDEGAFEAWYRTAVPLVFGFVHGRTGGDVTLAEDITAEAFFEAVRARASFDGRSDPVTWICSIATNRLIDHYRKVTRERARQVRIADEQIRISTLAEGDLSGRDDVLTVLAAVPAVERMALFLRYIDGYSVPETAAIIGRTVPATESVLSRARERLRRALPGGVA
jgi:RNA polymerase sigma-70 factor (ECF subfamily)